MHAQSRIIWKWKGTAWDLYFMCVRMRAEPRASRWTMVKAWQKGERHSVECSHAHHCAWTMTSVMCDLGSALHSPWLSGQCYDFDRFRLYSRDRSQSVSDNALAYVQGASWAHEYKLEDVQYPQVWEWISQSSNIVINKVKEKLKSTSILATVIY